jgi:hypothetical protein
MTIEPDAHLMNADWTKRTWDMLNITNVEEMRRYLKGKRKSIEDFKKLPVYKWAIRNHDPPWMKNL